MQMETEYRRLPMPVTLGSRFGDWRVCWLGGWERHRIYYLVMLVRVADGEESFKKETPPGTMARRRWSGTIIWRTGGRRARQRRF
jgi:hypothetical protein